MPDPGHEPATLQLQSGVASDLERLHPWLEAASRCLPKPSLHGMQIALEEVVMNIAMHAFPPGVSGEITIRLTRSADAATLIVDDFGRAFDPATAPVRQLAASLKEVEPGGLGLTLMRHYCKDISYERAGDRNRLTMRFPLPPA